jgi:hypothetical protein
MTICLIKSHWFFQCSSCTTTEVSKSLGVKATFAVSVAASIGVKLGLSAVAIATGVLMKNSINKVVSVWCGVAFLRRPRLGQAPPHSRDSAGDQRRIVPLRNAGRFNSSPPHLAFPGSQAFQCRLPRPLCARLDGTPMATVRSKNGSRNRCRSTMELSGTCPISQLNRRTNGAILRQRPRV